LGRCKGGRLFVRFPAIFLLAAFLLVSFMSAEAGEMAGVARLARLLPRNARWGLIVQDFRSGGEIASFGNAREEPLIPGSVAKLFVTGAVLDRVERGEDPQEFLPRGKRRDKVFQAGARLQRFLRDMNVHSRNRSADALFLRLGELRFGGAPTREKGQKAMAEFLAGLGLPAEGEALVDGSGLSKENRLPPRFVLLYLLEIGRKPWFEKFRATLPRAGIEGTVKEIGYADPRFRVKSGRLDNAFALAGYGVAPQGREVAFVYMVNVPAGRIITDRRHSRGAVVRMIARGTLR
jgi:D-alanyl-D-alanine carboxypeptidase